jgi:hypothetical protein
VVATRTTVLMLGAMFAHVSTDSTLLCYVPPEADIGTACIYEYMPHNKGIRQTVDFSQDANLR